MSTAMVELLKELLHSSIPEGICLPRDPKSRKFKAAEVLQEHGLVTISDGIQPYVIWIKLLRSRV